MILICVLFLFLVPTLYSWLRYEPKGHALYHFIAWSKFKVKKNQISAKVAPEDLVEVVREKARLPYWNCTFYDQFR